MSWLTNFVRPKLQALVNNQKNDVPDNLWTRCPSCEQMLFQKELNERLRVCKHCGHHLRLDAEQRLTMLFDEGQFATIKLPEVPHDPLKFKDLKKYSDRLKESQTKTGSDDALLVGKGFIQGTSVVIAAFNFDFMGGSMGTAVGEGLVKAAETACDLRCPLIVVPSSGGARMQEGILSLMQMARSTIAVTRMKEHHLPYITLLADPTTGGVSASFAMLGDIAIAEPGALIGFTGVRVIQQTIRQELPPGFQKAEYLLEHGMIDMVVPRDKLRQTLGNITSMLMNRKLQKSA
jgi:acetyl-CoA carboxylase carboxyl transferase subunit beta